MTYSSKFRLILFGILLCNPGCKKKPTPKPFVATLTIPEKKVVPLTPKTKRHIVVLIHGTLLPIPSLECMGAALHTFLVRGRTLNKSIYQIYLDELKRNTIFKYQPNGPDGLHPVSIETPKTSAQISSAMLTDFYQESLPDVQLSCYTFGWSGRLSQRKRVNASSMLYQQLVAEIKKINDPDLSITLIGHSHGGNVILNLARAEKMYKQNLVIDKAILLGTPIQSETKLFIESPIFKSVYHFYSNGDSIQKLDFISTKDDHSQRRFNLTTDNDCAKKLTQIELTLGQYKPGHAELWLRWGKNNSYYRKKLPTFPMPVFVFLPEIIQQLEKFYPKRHDVMVNIDHKETNYTINVYDNDAKTERSTKEIVTAMIPKKIFAPSIKEMFLADKMPYSEDNVKKLAAR